MVPPNFHLHAQRPNILLAISFASCMDQHSRPPLVPTRQPSAHNAGLIPLITGSYIPPACDFNRITFNLTVTSRGRQFDRLALMYFNDTEIFRTSTAEPTANGIIWTYIKDMSAYLPLFKESQKIIFDLGNLIDDTYTGSFNTTLTASFYAEPESSFIPANLILPVSARKASTDSASAFNLPADNATNTLTLPQNIDRAIFSISACGQSTEEFWWANVLSSDVSAFGSVTTLYGYSPWREVQLYIDGALAGVVWPFPIIFTGGVAPGFWRPIVGIDAFDLKEDQIDITPWLPLLCDGAAHSFEIRVTGLNDTSGQASLSETVGSYWVVTGKVFLWLSSDPSSITTGTLPTISAPAPSIAITSSTTGTSPNGTNATLDYSVSVSRDFHISSSLATWSQSLTFTNTGNYSAAGALQINKQTTSGRDVATASNTTVYEREYAYPLLATTLATESGSNYSIAASLDRAKSVTAIGASAFPLGLEGYPTNASGTHLVDRQWGNATYLSVTEPSPQSFSGGTTAQDLSFWGVGADGGEGELLYTRHVVGVNGTVTVDEGSGVGSSGRRAWMAPVGVEQKVLMGGMVGRSVAGRENMMDGGLVAEKSPSSSLSSKKRKEVGVLEL